MRSRVGEAQTCGIEAHRVVQYSRVQCNIGARRTNQIHGRWCGACAHLGWGRRRGIWCISRTPPSLWGGGHLPAAAAWLAAPR
eukprot:945866-Prorocentrum_minimum.AAC.1